MQSHELKKYPLIPHNHHDESQATDYGDNPHIYSSMWEYVLSSVGVCVGLGAFWRFPYLVYKNGGGAFLIPYIVAMVFMGMPLYFLQTTIGQMHRVSIPFAFKKMHPSLKIIGIAMLTSTVTFSTVYNILLTYCYRYLFTSFENPLPFAQESITENSYFYDKVLHQSESIGQWGGLNPLLFVIFIASLFLCHAVIKNGVKTSSKIIMVTAISPFIIFFILIIRGLFLSGASNGIVFLFKPKWHLLLTPGIWVDAATQCFFQFSIGMAVMVNLSMQKPRRDNILNSVVMVPIGLFVCGILSALTIFIYLAHFCLVSGYEMGDPRLKLAGLELSLNVLPKALFLLPFPNFWLFIFFLTLVLLGIDSQFGQIEAIYCYLRDQFRDGPRKICGFTIDYKKSQYLSLLIMCSGAFLLASRAGIYYLNFFDYYMSNILYALWALIQLYFFVHVADFEDLMATVAKYTKHEIPPILKRSLKSPALFLFLTIIIIFAAINQIFSYERFGFGAYLFGWFISTYPLFMIYYYMRGQWEGWSKVKRTFRQFQEKQIEC